jgi:hypothetical protein
MMAKYDSLTGFLKAQTASELAMSFGDVEQVVGAKLPPSAYRHRPWWANEAANHVHAKAWLNAGFQTGQVDMQAKKLVFKRVHQSRLPDAGMAEPQAGFKHDDSAAASKRHPIIGALKGLLIVEPGYDLTQPAMPEWADLLAEKYGPEKPK